LRRFLIGPRQRRHPFQLIDMGGEADAYGYRKEPLYKVIPIAGRIFLTVLLRRGCSWRGRNDRCGSDNATDSMSRNTNDDFGDQYLSVGRGSASGGRTLRFLLR
jgi:hypothetical protein